MVGNLAWFAVATSSFVLAANIFSPEGILFSFAEYGVLGIAVIILALALVRKDRQVNALYDRLIEKSDKDSQKYHELAEALNDTLKELTEAVIEIGE